MQAISGPGQVAEDVLQHRVHWESLLDEKNFLLVVVVTYPYHGEEVAFL